jgi:hypothetical protein
VFMTTQVASTKPATSAAAASCIAGMACERVSSVIETVAGSHVILTTESPLVRMDVGGSGAIKTYGICVRSQGSSASSRH